MLEDQDSRVTVWSGLQTKIAVSRTTRLGRYKNCVNLYPSYVLNYCKLSGIVNFQQHLPDCIDEWRHPQFHAGDLQLNNSNSDCLFSDSSFVCVPSSLCVHCQYMSPVHLQSHTMSCSSPCLYSDSSFVCVPSSLCVHCHYVPCSLSFTHCTAYMH